MCVLTEVCDYEQLKDAIPVFAPARYSRWLITRVFFYHYYFPGLKKPLQCKKKPVHVREKRGRPIVITTQPSTYTRIVSDVKTNTFLGLIHAGRRRDGGSRAIRNIIACCYNICFMDGSQWSVRHDVFVVPS